MLIWLLKVQEAKKLHSLRKKKAKESNVRSISKIFATRLVVRYIKKYYNFRAYLASSNVGNTNPRKPFTFFKKSSTTDHDFGFKEYF